MKLLPTAHCHVTNLRQDSFPFLTIDDGDVRRSKIEWSSGFALESFLECDYVQVSRHGLRCIGSSSDLFADWMDHSSGVYTPSSALMEPGGWARMIPCTPSPTSMCHSVAQGVQVFPSDEVLLSNMTLASLCMNSQGRVLVSGEHEDQSTKAPNDLSLCDVSDRNLHITYDTGADLLLVQDLTNNSFLYIVVSILFLIGGVLLFETFSNRDASLPVNLVSVVLLVVTTSLLLLGVDKRVPGIIVKGDWYGNLSTVLYIVICSLFWLTQNTQFVTLTGGQMAEQDKTKAPPSQRFALNTIIASLYYANTVLHGGTPENAYTLAFFFLLVFRVLQKTTEWAEYTPTADAGRVLVQLDTGHRMLFLCDMFFLYTVFVYGVVPFFYNEREAIYYAIGFYVVSDLLSAIWKPFQDM